MVQAEQTDDGTYFTIKKHMHNGASFFYESYGPTRLVGGHYKMITYLSLEEYNKKHETLGERINNLVNACKAIKSSLCEKYQNILSHLYDEITNRRRRRDF
jgi:hypothetical protein